MPPKKHRLPLSSSQQAAVEEVVPQIESVFNIILSHVSIEKQGKNNIIF